MVFLHQEAFMGFLKAWGELGDLVGWQEGEVVQNSEVVASFQERPHPE